MNVPESGFNEIEHTADWALQVWGPDLPALFVQAAKGMNALAEVKLEEGERIEHTFSFDAPVIEGLLVKFLEEILFCGEMDALGFDEFDISIGNGYHLEAKVLGAPIASLDKEIKAVTFHNMDITETESGYEVVIVFDV